MVFLKTILSKLSCALVSKEPVKRRLHEALGAGAGGKGPGAFPALRFPPNASKRDKSISRM